MLVVGAGPIGLGTAIELGWRGIDCMVLEQGDGVLDHPKVGFIAVRTMEFCRRWGIVDRVRACGFPDDFKLDVVYCTSMTGHLLEREPYPSQAELEPPTESPEKKQRCPQLWFDPILAKAAGEFDSVELRYHCRLEGFEQDADGVTAQAKDLKTGDALEIRARYLVGCDGMTGSIRRELGIERQGKVLTYSAGYLLRIPNFFSLHNMGQAERYIFVGRQGAWGNFTVVDGRDLWRLTLIGTDAETNYASMDVAAHVRRALGRDDVQFEILTFKPWRRTELIADRFREGRVFLAGDAAHTMSPTGGFGMNTGIGDSVDIGWKLEATLKGWGGPRLLDSYELERRPVALRNASAATSYFRAWQSATDCGAILEDSEAGKRTRRAVGEHLRSALLGEWESMGVQIGYRYEGSAICVPDGTPSPPDKFMEYIPTTRAGARAPHAWLPDGRSMLDLFGRGFALLRFTPAAPNCTALLEAARSRGVPLTVTQIDDPAIAALYERKLVLVRPDGHSAWRADAPPADPLAVIDAIRGAKASDSLAAARVSAV